METRAKAIAAIAGLFAAWTASAYDVNKDLTNLGPGAHDLTVILSGSETVGNHFDGYTSGPLAGRFNSFAHGPNGPNTEMKWDNFTDGGNNTIDTGQTIHVGWSTTDHSSNVKDMYYTDATGQRIPGSKVYNITSGWTYETALEIASLEFENLFDETVFISDPAWAIYPTPWPLEALNRFNTVLDADLSPLTLPAPFVIPGDTMSVGLPGLVPDGWAVVARYSMEANSSTGFTTDYVQFVVPEPAVIPLLALAGVVGLRRRR